MVRILLNHFKWDAKALLNSYYEAMDKLDMDNFFQEAQLVDWNNQTNVENTLVDKDEDAKECKICYSELDEEVGIFNRKHFFL
mgnify:CR=1 FL=1